MSDRPGLSSTSSNVKASRIALPSLLGPLSSPFGGGRPQYVLGDVAFGDATGIAVESRPIGGVDAGR